MPLSQAQIRSDYPLPVYNYRVEIGSEAVAFSEVSGLGIQLETHVYVESPTGGRKGPQRMYMPAQPGPVKVTLKKGVVRQSSVKALYQWIASAKINQIEKKDIFVRLCDEKGDPVLSWKVLNAFPTKLDAPTFDAKSNDAAVETMELMADRVEVDEA